MRIPTFIQKHLKIWGVGLETDLPPEFWITKHGKDRLRERVGVNPEKMDALVIKAWYSKDVPIPKLEITKNKNEYFGRNRVARELMGKVYIFAYSKPRNPFPTQKVLITVI